MFGLFRPFKRIGSWIAIVLLLGIGIGLIWFYVRTPHATLSITIGPAGSAGQRLVTALIAGTRALHPRVAFNPVLVPDLAGSSKAMENGKVDIALIRSDVAPPSNANTLVIVRRDVVAIVTSGASSIDNPSELSGNTVAIPAGPTQNDNSHAFDLILDYFNVSRDSVKRSFLPIAEIGEAVRRGHAAAAVAVGPIGPGDIVDVVTSIEKATKRTPKIVDLDNNDAIAARFPSLESIDIPKGAFRARPAVPDDDISGVAVSYRFVVSALMPDLVAGALGRGILNEKARLMALTPLASQIQAPDTSAPDPILPVHPGFANYLNNGDQSFFDAIQTYIYVIGIPLSLLGSLVAMAMSLYTGRAVATHQKKLFRLIAIAEEAATADAGRLKALDDEYGQISSSCIGELLSGSLGTDHGPVTLAIQHAGRAIQRRRDAIGVAHA